MKNKVFSVGFIGIMLVIGMIVISCGNGTTGDNGTTGGNGTTGSNGTTGVSSGPKTVTIKYQLTGTVATANSLSYKNSTGGTDSLSNVTLPWEKTLSVTIEKNQGFYATLSASSTNGSLTAKIFVDGTEVENVTSSGSGFFTVVALESITNY